MNFSRRRWLLSAGGSAFFASVANALQTATPRAAAAAGMPGTADDALKVLLKNAACGVTYYSDSSGNKITIPTVTAFESSLNSIYKDRFNKKYPFSPTAWENLLWQSVALGAWIAFVQLREDKTGGAFNPKYLHQAREEFGWNRNNIMIPQSCLPSTAATTAAPTGAQTGSTTTTTTATTGAVAPSSSAGCAICS
jgi:hypothetical protein